jgi:hypothetical protein
LNDIGASIELFAVGVLADFAQFVVAEKILFIEME